MFSQVTVSHSIRGGYVSYNDHQVSLEGMGISRGVGMSRGIRVCLLGGGMSRVVWGGWDVFSEGAQDMPRGYTIGPGITPPGMTPSPEGGRGMSRWRWGQGMS